jgi:hypothetical protein
MCLGVVVCWCHYWHDLVMEPKTQNSDFLGQLNEIKDPGQTFKDLVNLMAHLFIVIDYRVHH